ncbi:hypothetical protein [Rhizobium sp. BK251]|uniref:hypothetical protein n=1 Tax=Rhizobium sp. BK251 TaxID=2512125 RepID=UPI001043384C|nr:hypothetical protein [Rhizobium sp. BK251]TCL70647.1 hypothetical protein EV286_107525 [Rhizobium sp. BK251]
MAYKSDNLAMVINPTSGALPRLFIYYNEDADSNATIIGASFFTNGVTMGMRKGDLVDAVNVATPKHTRYQVLSTSGAAATVQAVAAV